MNVPAILTAYEPYVYILGVLLFVLALELLIRQRRRSRLEERWKTGKLIRVLDRILNPPARRENSTFIF